MSSWEAGDAVGIEGGDGIGARMGVVEEGWRCIG
jgi:hypothetical protein